MIFFGVLLSLISGLISGFLFPSIISSDLPASDKEGLFIIFGFFAFAFLIGICFISVGLKKLIQKRILYRKGFETYAKIDEILQRRYLNSRSNGRDVNYNLDLTAVLLVVDKNNTQFVFKKPIGSDRDAYSEGEILKVIYYKDQLEIVEKIQPYYIPENIRDIFEIKNDKCSKMFY